MSTAVAVVDATPVVRDGEHASLSVAEATGGRCRGRPRALTADQVRCARTLLDEFDASGRPVHTYAEAARHVGVARATLYRYLGPR